MPRKPRDQKSLPAPSASALGVVMQATRLERGLSIAEVAAAARMTPRRLAALEEGRSEPDLKALLSIPRALNVRASHLIRRAERIDYDPRAPQGRTQHERKATAAGRGLTLPVDYPDALILAALARAELHNRDDKPGELYATVVDHLGLPMGSATGRKLRPRFREMEAAGLITPLKRYGLILHTATPKGKRVLRAAGAVALPESPQHRDWREAHAAAVERIQGFRDDLATLLRDGRALLADADTGSEDWFTFGERIGGACSRLASSIYCLREWAEPTDDKRDTDDGPRRGRRNTRRWDCPYA